MVGVLKITNLLYIFLIWSGTEAHLPSRNSTTRSMLSNYKFKTTDAVSTTKIPTKITGKWQVGRVSRKQYEIINMLHRKTITFLETEGSADTTRNSIKLSKYAGLFNKKQQHITLPPEKPRPESFQGVYPRPNDRPLTPSYIEFYYLDEFDDRVKRKNSMPKHSLTALQGDEHKFALLRPPFFLFRVNDATCKPTTLNYMTSSFHDNKHYLAHNPKASILKEIEKSKEKHAHKCATKNVDKIEMKHKKNITENKKLSFLLRDRFTPMVPTTPYDRIKFFEIYDSDTYKPRRLIDDKLNIISSNNIHSEEKIYLDEVDHDTDNHKSKNISRYVRKQENYNLEEGIKNLVPRNDKISNYTPTTQTTRKTLTKQSRPAKWSEFPFIAVYVYEPMQVRCESASINPHWLVASATCLYRHYRNVNSDTEGRSAFVTYCGDNWRLPGRIAYVKRAFIHPRFQAKNKTRRYLYNIGVIQVVNSMANTCSGWQPVSLMSHQFVADRDGSLATAVGWGLDRYDARYSSSDLPSYPLMLYEGRVYSDSCPGNADYSKVKMLNEESVKNVYCLSLPTYTLEKNDTVHGGLLLIGGKLIALYLQEERRSWGVQSAQYTGIWRLIPWLLDIAHEVEELQTFASNM